MTIQEVIEWSRAREKKAAELWGFIGTSIVVHRNLDRQACADSIEEAAIAWRLEGARFREALAVAVAALRRARRPAGPPMCQDDIDIDVALANICTILEGGT